MTRMCVRDSERERERATESLLILNYLAVNELSTGQNPHMAAAVP